MPERLIPYINFVTDRPVLIVLAVCLIVALGFLFGRSGGRWLKHIQPKPLLTGNEAEFLRRLQRALPGHHVFPQVSFGAFITDDGSLSRNARWSVRARFDRKIADFVVCDRNLKVLALIELDDRTHIASADRQRDALTKAAGYQTFRFQSKRKPSEQEIATLFQHARAWSNN